MRVANFLVLFLLAGSASAQSVYKCVGKGGETSFQSHPCDSGAEAAKVWDATPGRPSNAEQWQRYNARKKAANDAAYLRRLAHGAPSGGAGTDQVTHVPKQTSRCANARQQRDTFYANNPRRTSKDMERWNRHVYDSWK